MPKRWLGATLAGLMALTCMGFYVAFFFIDQANAAPIERFDADPGCARHAKQVAGSVCDWSRGRLAFAGTDADGVSVVLSRPGKPPETVRLRSALCASIVTFLKQRDTSVRAETFAGHVIRLETPKRTFSTTAYPAYPPLLTTRYGYTAILIWQSSVGVLVIILTMARRQRFVKTA